MKNKFSDCRFTRSEVDALVFCMRFFVRLAKKLKESPLEMYPKHVSLGITALIHDLLRFSGYYEYNEK